ncbi:MAG: LUD domain-containing protein [Cyanobacteriota bacterium]
MTTHEKDLKQLIKLALADEDLQKGLEKAIKNFKHSRKEALKDINFKKVQQELSHIRSNNINNLEKNLETFKSNCRNNGITVFETTNSENTCQKVFEIIQNHRGNKVVKAKSMVTEEIDLNNFLAMQNIESVETDLGEWLVQLAGEKPSHITAPALHMTKERISKLLNENFKTDIKPDPKEITKFARQHLRQYFIDADIGITGANLLVAETGSIIIISNEGNARLVSTLPEVHIIVTTIEKLVESMSDAHKILHILPKSATGQSITSYISIISGPSKTADVEKELVYGVHGPEHVYLVLMDNGRKTLLENQDFKEILNCIKCGACLGMCPVYQAVGGHVFGKKYFGGVGAILTTFIENLDSSKDLTRLCAGCGICKDICPINIDIPLMVLKLKEMLFLKRNLTLSKEIIIKSLFSNKALFEFAFSTASTFQNLFYNKDEIKTLPGPLSSLTHFRNLPSLSKKTLSQLVKETNIIKPYEPNKTPIILFSGCLIEKVYPEFGLNTIKLLQYLNFNVLYPEDQTCCGVPALYSGDTKDYKKFITENKKGFAPYSNYKAEYIVTICPSCTRGIKDENIFNNTNVVDLAYLLYTLNPKYPLKVIPLKSLTYHPSCHYSKDDQYLTYTHKLLKELYENEFVEHYDMYNCCGSAGSYAIELSAISEKIIDKKLTNIIDSKANNIVTDCPSCYMQLKGTISKRNLNINVIYITDLFNL